MKFSRYLILSNRSHPMKIKAEGWFYCTLCATVAYDFECCKGTSCNAGGCDKCAEIWDEVSRRVDAGEHPPEQELVHTGSWSS